MTLPGRAPQTRVVRLTRQDGAGDTNPPQTSAGAAFTNSLLAAS